MWASSEWVLTTLNMRVGFVRWWRNYNQEKSPNAMNQESDHNNNADPPIEFMARISCGTVTVLDIGNL